MLCLRLFQRLLLPGLRPVREHLASELLNLLYGHRFGFIGSRTVGYGLFHLIGNLLQPPIGTRSFGKAFVQSFPRPFFFRQFIAHELLYLYTFSKSTISKLRIILPSTSSRTRAVEFGWNHWAFPSGMESRLQPAACPKSDRFGIILRLRACQHLAS